MLLATGRKPVLPQRQVIYAPPPEKNGALRLLGLNFNSLQRLDGFADQSSNRMIRTEQQPHHSTEAASLSGEQQQMQAELPHATTVAKHHQQSGSMLRLQSIRPRTASYRTANSFAELPMLLKDFMKQPV
ncbi:hypothetical protein WJX82_011523 [Trebouxia sp. C0006]